jgi:hypothetical protein
MTKKIFTIAVVISMLIPGCLFYSYQHINQNITHADQDTQVSPNESTNYSTSIEFNQETLHLQQEVAQYEIKFRHNDSVDVSVSMYVSYVDSIITSNYFLLTDGVKLLMKPRNVFYVPERKYVLITPRIQISIGKFWLIKLLNDREGKIRVGSASNDSGHFDVHSGDTWYLTLAVPTSSEKSGYDVTFTSHNNSMEVTQLMRNGNLGFFAANYNQFSGKYYAVKLSILGGMSICNINKEITTQNGSIIDVYVVAHRKGSMIVSRPDNEEKSFNEKAFMHYAFLGNETGKWTFKIKGWSLYYRMLVTLLYIDIDPHVQMVEGE